MRYNSFHSTQGLTATKLVYFKITLCRNIVVRLIFQLSHFDYRMQLCLHFFFNESKKKALHFMCYKLNPNQRRVAIACKETFTL